MAFLFFRSPIFVESFSDPQNAWSSLVGLELTVFLVGTRIW